ncbi:MAG: DUF3971 domain-containing protein [Sedimenticola sp.]|nr:DUF3971 domain-containing protein [Sedimenticola sp.]
MKRLLHFSYRSTKRLLILLVVGLGLLIVFGRLLAPMAAQYRAEVEQWTSDLLGQPITVGRLRGDWRGLGPVLVLYDLQLIDPKRNAPTLYLSEVRVALDLLSSLRQLSPVVRKVSFVSPRLRVIRQANGAITVGNLDQLNELEPGDGSSAFLLPSHLSLVNGEIIWEDQASGAPPLRLTRVDLRLRNSGTRHQLDGSLTLPGSGGGTLQLAVDLTAQPDRLSTWHARSYTRSQGIDLALLLNRRMARDYRFSNRQAEIELWGEWDQDGLINLQGSTDWEQVEIRRRGDRPDRTDASLSLDRLSTDLRLLRLEQGWQLDLNRLEIQRGNRRWPQTRISLRATQDDSGAWELVAGSRHTRIEDVSAISALIPIADRTLEQGLQQVQGSGSLDDLQLRFREQADGFSWEAHGRLSDFSSRPWNGLPGLDNLALTFWMDAQQGTLSLDSQNVSIDFEQLFRDPLQLGRLAGEVAFTRAPGGGVTVESRALLAENDDISTRSRLHLAIPDGPDSSPFLDLQTDFRDGDASSTSRYLPTGIMGQEVVAWVDRSIGPGRVTHGSALVRGPLDDFPFHRRHSGRFEVFFNVEGLELDYWPGWPALQGLSARVRFLNNRFDAWADGGRILDSQIGAIHAEIEDLLLTAPLQLDGSVSGPLGDPLRLLRESPLKEDFGPLVKGIHGEGETRLEIGFSLPIEEVGEFALDGRLEFLDSRLVLDEWPFDLERINGALRFDQDHLFASDIRARALDIPLQIDVDRSDSRRQATRVIATSTLPLTTLQRQLPALTSVAALSGESRWRLQLDIPHLSAGPDAGVAVSLGSNLVGTRIDLPAPLGKPATESRALLLETVLTQQAGPLHVRYGEQLDARLAFDRSEPESPRLSHAGITLGGGQARLPGTPGIEIIGQLAMLPLDHWLQATTSSGSTPSLPPLNRVELAVDTLQIGQQATDNVRFSLERGSDHWQGTLLSEWGEGSVLLPLQATGSSALRGRFRHLRIDPWLPLLSPRATGNDIPAFSQLSLNSDRIAYQAIALDGFSLQLERTPARWHGTFSSDRASGQLTLPQDLLAAPVQLEMDRLSLTLDETLLDQVEQSSTPDAKPIDPTRVPALQAEVKELIINDKPFGSLQLISQRREQGLALQTLSLSSPRLQLSGTGSWLREAGGRPVSRFDLSLSSADFGSVLKDLALSENLEGAPVEIDSRLHWPGGPLDLSSARLNGQLGMQIDKGRFLKVDPGVGRLFGLFNLGALRRRLTLDFSDIFKKGFAFDTIEGNFLLDSGDAFTNDFRMQGPSANIELSGRIGLGDEDFDALVTITPKFSSSIPLAGAIAGGPAVGAALFIAQQLVGDSLDKVTQLQYMATGSWDDPVLTPKLRETPEGGSLSDTDGELHIPDDSTSTTDDADDTGTGGPAVMQADDPDTSSPGVAQPEDGAESNLLKRLLKKLKPTGPTYTPEPQNQP